MTTTDDIQELIALYADYAAKHGELLLSGDSDANNIVVDALAETVQQLKHTTGGDLAPLRVLLDHNNVNVRRCAAGQLLWTCEHDAVNVMEQIANEGGIAALIAGTVLDEWRTGRLTPP